MKLFTPKTIGMMSKSETAELILKYRLNDDLFTVLFVTSFLIPLSRYQTATIDPELFAWIGLFGYMMNVARTYLWEYNRDFIIKHKVTIHVTMQAISASALMCTIMTRDLSINYVISNALLVMMLFNETCGSYMNHVHAIKTPEDRTAYSATYNRRCTIVAAIGAALGGVITSGIVRFNLDTISVCCTSLIITQTIDMMLTLKLYKAFDHFMDAE